MLLTILNTICKGQNILSDFVTAFISIQHYLFLEIQLEMIVPING